MGEVDRWSNIHQDLLYEITKRFHSYENDYLQLRLVCKQWNLKLPKIPNGNKVPWLLLPIGGGGEEEDIYHIMQLPTIDEQILDTGGLEEEGIYHLILPELQDNNICGSCHGWVIIVMVHEGTIKMLNPFTKVHFELPPISTLPNVIDINGDECTIYFGGRIVTRNTILMHKTQIWKAIINSTPSNDNNNDFIAVVIYGCLSSLAFYKPNDKRWLRFPLRCTNICDVIFFQEKIYAVDYEGQLYEFDTKNKSGPVGRIFEATPPPWDVVLRKFYYLIGCDNGSLLMLIRHIRRPYIGNKKCSVETVKFYVYELKKNEKVWSRIYDLGNYILVIGLNSSVQMLSSNFSNCKGNQIYFTDSMCKEHPSNFASRHDLGIFNLEDGSFKRLLTDVNFFCSPVWVLS
ncbi:hypothetical protein HN873_013448 [Arachis hypogaea]